MSRQFAEKDTNAAAGATGRQSMAQDANGLLHLQRLAGNRAVHDLVVQREPNLAGPSLLAPNADASGVPYDVPGSNYLADAQPVAPSLDKPMPTAQIPSPEAMPGWKVTYTPPPTNIGPFTWNSGPTEHVVTKHSPMMTSAWDSYRFHFLPDVVNTWNTMVPKIDSFTREKAGDPTLEKTVKEMTDKWNITIAGDKGNVADQTGSSRVTAASPTTVADAAAGVAGKGEQFGKDLAATGAKDGSTTGTPVQVAVTNLQAVRDEIRGHLGKMGTDGMEILAATQAMQAATAEMRAKSLQESKEGVEKKKANLENGTAFLNKIDPQFGPLMLKIKELAEPLAAVKGMVSGAAQMAEGNVAGGALEAAKGAAALVKWNEVQQLKSQLAILDDGIKSALDEAAVNRYFAASNLLTAKLASVTNMATQAEGMFLREKGLYIALADVVSAPKNWKGGDQGDAKLAADALRAIPTVQKLNRYLQDVLTAIPKPPEPRTNVDKAYTLAKSGIGATGVTELLQVTGWILGARAAVQAEATKWQQIGGQLQMVAAKLGVQ
jgi:hypothetical protein